jgi:hypothetical protein
MSSSEENRGSVPVQISADPATETFVIDHAFRLVARGVGNFTCDLVPGLYKFKFRSGLAVAEAPQEVLPDSPAPQRITAPALAFSSAAPLQNTRRVSDDQLGEAERVSSGPATRHGNGSFLFLFVRCEGDGPPPPNAAEGLTLHSIDGALIADVAAAPSSSADCAGLLVELDPGPFRLRMVCEGGPLEQVVITCGGWQTQAFLRRDTANLRASTSLATASVLMSRGAFHAGDEMLRYADAARIALAGKRVTMPRELLQGLLDEKFDNPMLGIYAAHALCATDSDSLLQRVIEALQRLIPGHPDVVSLSFGQAKVPPIGVPPMLRSSWASIIDATLDGRAQLEPGSLAARIPSSLLEGTPWLIWPEPALLPLLNAPREVTQQLVDIQRFFKASTEDLSDSLELSDSENALYSYLSRRARLQRRPESRSLATPLDEHGLARAFGTTLPAVQDTVDGLAAKLFNVTKKEVL